VPPYIAVSGIGQTTVIIDFIVAMPSVVHFKDLLVVFPGFSLSFHVSWSMCAERLKSIVLKGSTMDILDLEPRKPKPKPKNLDEMSIEALQEYIEEIEAEIERVQEAISAKKSARNGAESVFR
jgi:uncharacterized small protein (DUF1192 family)